MSTISLWPSVRLADAITDMQPGFAQRPNSDNIGTPQLRTNNVSPEGTLDLTEQKFVRTTPSDLQKYGVRKGDVIFNNTNSIEWVGKTAYFDWDESYVLSNHMTRIRTNSAVLDGEFLARYLHYLWQTGVSRRWAKRWVSQAAIDQAGLSDFMIPLPPLPEQRRIVAILRQADQLRKLRRAVDERARDLLPALFYEMFGDPLTNERGWEQKAIREMGEVTTGNTPPRNDSRNYGDFIEWIKSDNINETKDYVTKSKEYLSREGAAKGRIAPEGSTLITCIAGSHESIGKAALTDRDVAFNQQINAVTPYEDVNLFYLYAVIKFCKSAIQSLSSKGMKGIVNKSQLEGVKLIAPPYELQEEFAVRAVELFEIKDQQIEANRFCEVLFQSLLAQALNGELTATWREHHAEELAKAAAERDQLLDKLRDDGQPSLFDVNIIPPGTESALDVESLATLVPPAVDQLLAHARPANELITSLAQGTFSTLSEQMRTAAQVNTSLVDASVLRGVSELPSGVQQSLAASLQPILDAKQALMTTMQPIVDMKQTIADYVQPIIDTQRLVAQWMEPMRSTFDTMRGFSVGLAEMLARVAEMTMVRPGSDHPRHQFLVEISDEQYQLYRLVSDEAGYFTPESLSERYQIPLDAARRGLQLLAAAGLIVPVSLPISPTNGTTLYVAAFRAADDEDDVRLSDLAMLEGPAA